jgi:hypothetical protein
MLATATPTKAARGAIHTGSRPSKHTALLVPSTLRADCHEVEQLASLAVNPPAFRLQHCGKCVVPWDAGGRAFKSCRTIYVIYIANRRITDLARNSDHKKGCLSEQIRRRLVLVLHTFLLFVHADIVGEGTSRRNKVEGYGGPLLAKLAAIARTPRN